VEIAVAKPAGPSFGREELFLILFGVSVHRPCSFRAISTRNPRGTLIIEDEDMRNGTTFFGSGRRERDSETMCVMWCTGSGLSARPQVCKLVPRGRCLNATEGDDKKTTLKCLVSMSWAVLTAIEDPCGGNQNQW
jgi:hypothetical protein